MSTESKNIFNSKELDKILPSYLLDEIDEEQNKKDDESPKSVLQSNDVSKNDL